MGWISIEERMPENGERALLYTPFEVFGEDHSCIGDKESIISCKTRLCGKVVPLFTHWMPLPEMPDSRVMTNR